MDDFPLPDEFAVRATLARYCHRCDDGDFAGVVALFTADGIFTYRDRTARGSAELLAFFDRSQGKPGRRGKHLTVNTVVEPDFGPEPDPSLEPGTGPGRVLAVSDYVFLRAEGERLVPAIAGRYRDELVKVDGQWLIARRDALDLRDAPAMK